MHWVTDMMGRNVDVPAFPVRIVSLVPSQTEFLYALGLEPRIVGITKFCIHPNHARKTATVIGGTKQIHIDRLKHLAPDLIIGNKEENDRDIIRLLENDYPVWMSDISNLSDAYSMMEQVGRITQTEEAANSLTKNIRSAFSSMAPVPVDKLVRAAYIIWKEPWMGVGNKTFIHEMIEIAGFRNVLAHKERYPIITLEELQLLSPNVLFLSSEPYPFKEKHCTIFRTFLPNTKIL